MALPSFSLVVITAVPAAFIAAAAAATAVVIRCRDLAAARHAIVAKLAYVHYLHHHLLSLPPLLPIIFVNQHVYLILLPRPLLICAPCCLSKGSQNQGAVISPAVHALHNLAILLRLPLLRVHLIKVP